MLFKPITGSRSQGRSTRPAASGIIIACSMLLLLLLLQACGGQDSPASFTQSGNTRNEGDAANMGAANEGAADNAASVPDSREPSASPVSLPVITDFPEGPVWDTSLEPTRDNGPWAQSCAVYAALEEQARAFSDVKPQRVFSLACHDPEESGPAQLMIGFANAVTVSTQGQVKINIGLSGSLSAATSSMDDMKQGLIDFVWTLPCYFKGYMPLCNVIQNPSLALPSGSAASMVMWELYKSSPELQKEVEKNGVLLFACANCTSPLSCKGERPIQSLSEIHGNIRANNGPAQLFVEEAGGTVFSCPIGEVYNNIQHGIINYLITDWNGIDSFQLSDPGVLNHYLDTNIGCSVFTLLANADIWDSISPELQDGILAASGDYLLNLVGIWDYWESVGRYHAIERGGSIDSPSESLERELSSLYEKIAETWISQQSDPETARILYEKAKELAENAN